MKINLLFENTDWKNELQAGFRTERLSFQPLSEEDLKPLFAISSDKEIYAYLDGIKQPNELEEWLRSVYQKRNYYFFSINGNDDCEFSGAMIGVVLLNKVEKNMLEIGGWIGKKYHNMGFGSETVKGVFQFLKQTKPDMSLVAKTRADNHAAMKILDVKGIEKRVNRCHEKP